MTGIDELLRTALRADAATVLAEPDLVARSVAQGRRIRHRRRAGLGALAAVTTAGVIAGATLLGDHVGGDHALAPARSGHKRTVSVRSVHPVPRWQTWPRDRVFGTKPSASALDGLPSSSSTLASGTLPDGAQFWLYTTPSKGMPVSYYGGFRDQGLWGDNPPPGSPVYRARAPYFAFETLSRALWRSGKEDGPHRYWMVIVGQPDTTSASYTEDGSTWHPMKVQDGIAVIEVHQRNGALPTSAEVRLSDSDGLYADGPVDAL